MREDVKIITFTEDEYKIMLKALMELRNKYIDNEIIQEDINLIVEKVINSPSKKKGLFNSIEVR